MIGFFVLFEFISNTKVTKEKWMRFISTRIVTLKIIGYSIIKTIIPYTILAYSFQFGVDSGVASVLNSVG